MATTLRSSWSQNGEDVIFNDEAFHELAYRITGTYQRYLAELEQQHGERKTRHEAWIRGFRHKHEVGVGWQGQLFELPGYELRVRSVFTDKGISREASITLLFE